MFSYTELFIVAMMVVIIVMYIRQYYGEVEIVAARTDGRRYIVRKLPDAQEAAELLARINAKLQRLVAHMAAAYPTDASVRRLQANYDPDALSEGGIEVGYTSYSVNKGEKIIMCLRQRDDAFVDENVLVYVAVHELGHLMTAEIGHVPVFWSNFKRLAEEAVAIGVYTRVDFDAAPQPYCGISISSSVI
jgi:hypothetical protein